MEKFLTDEEVWEYETDPEEIFEGPEYWFQVEEEDERDSTYQKQKTLVSPPKHFSSEFLEKHHDLVLYDIFHQVQAFILFPLHCSCRDLCNCSEWRKRIVLALNTRIYNQACQLVDNPNRLYAMKALWRLPEDHAFRDSYVDSYPAWLTEQQLKNREKKNHFKIIEQLVWTFLRIGKATQSNSGAQKISLNKAMKIIIGETPINTKVSKLKNHRHLCGEKEYASNFKKYKFVFHFIAALEVCKKEMPDWEDMFSFIYLPIAYVHTHSPMEYIERFLSIAHWLRERLLILERDNVKDKVFLSEENICPLPSWVQSDDIDFPLELSEKELRKIKD